MKKPFKSLEKERRERKEKEQKDREKSERGFVIQKDKRKALFLTYDPMVEEVLQELKASFYPDLAISSDDWACKWVIERLTTGSREKEAQIAITLKWDKEFKPKCFRCERITGKFDFKGGPKYHSESKSLSKKDLISAMKKIHPAGTY